MFLWDLRIDIKFLKKQALSAGQEIDNYKLPWDYKLLVTHKMIRYFYKQVCPVKAADFTLIIPAVTHLIYLFLAPTASEMWLWVPWGYRPL